MSKFEQRTMKVQKNLLMIVNGANGIYLKVLTTDKYDYI